jgi:hypothetical protein
MLSKEEDFKRDLGAILIQEECRPCKIDIKKSAAMIRLLRPGDLPPTFSTASTPQRTCAPASWLHPGALETFADAVEIERIPRQP